MYSSGPNNGVVLRWKCMFVEKFQILLGEKTHVGKIFGGN